MRDASITLANACLQACKHFRHQAGCQRDAIGCTPIQVPANATKGSLRALKKDQLVSILRSKGLSDAGLKPELVERLYAALRQGDAPAAADSTPVAPANTADVQPPAEQPAAVMPAGEEAAVTAAAPVAAGRAAGIIAANSAAAGTASAAPADAAAAQAAVLLPATVPASGQRQQPPPPPPQQQSMPECEVPTGLAVQWLGTSSGAPTQHRNVSSIMLLRRRAAFMVDVGEGTINQLAAAGVDPILVKGYAVLAGILLVPILKRGSY